ncbi:unnamed protein product [Callosobruchus maculatus]|uniref:S-methyl-5'-thioadenosine phosphorylase n=1 Tax=Callosobruchus maculatus TaxID=64391 RepID=A0A653CHY8_CALMS|nr:unnamed protein product [Callosobruchus maculatus]
MAPHPVKIGIIGGTGMNDPNILKSQTEKKVDTPFGPPSDSLLVGEIEGVPCVVLARHGRQHNIMPSNVNYRANIWALKEEGCTHIIATTATGSLQEAIKPGDIVVLDSFIDRTYKREQTFYDGKSGHPKGICHLPVEPAFCEETRKAIVESAKKINMNVHQEGTVVVIEGPRYSTKAESMVYKSWGAHVITMTPVPEVILAKEAAICYGSIALVTDYDVWRSCGETVCAQEVIKCFKENIDKVKGLILATVKTIAEKDWGPTIKELQETVKNSIMAGEEECSAKK